MIVLDTDHVRVLRLGDARARALEERLMAANDPEIFTTIVSVHEGIKGWQVELFCCPATDTSTWFPTYEFRTGAPCERRASDADRREHGAPARSASEAKHPGQGTRSTSPQHAFLAPTFLSWRSAAACGLPR